MSKIKVKYVAQLEINSEFDVDENVETDMEAVIKKTNDGTLHKVIESELKNAFDEDGVSIIVTQISGDASLSV